jgi:hypothetical protein
MRKEVRFRPESGLARALLKSPVQKESARQVSVTLREDLIGAPAQEMNDRGAASFGNHPFGLTFRASRLYNPKEGHWLSGTSPIVHPGNASPHSKGA